MTRLWFEPTLETGTGLGLSEIHAGYGEAKVLRGVSLEVSAGEIVALLGRNGAGKTTTLRAISRFVNIESGTIQFCGEDLNCCSPQEVVARGIVHVPEGRHIFPRMTVHENLLMGAFLRQDRKAIHGDLEQTLQLFPALKSRLKQFAGTLSGGEQQMLAVARGLMARPKLLLLDEPSLGLAPAVIDDVYEIIRRLNDAGASILLVEQYADLALDVADRAYVMETGIIAASGIADELELETSLRPIYLGA